MIYFHTNPSASDTEHYDISIDDPAFTEYGFTEFRLPLIDNPTKMVLYNDKDRLMITYIDFDKHNLDKTVNCLVDKLLSEGKIDKEIAEGLGAYFRNACISRIEDKDCDFEFFKNGNGKGNKNGKGKGTTTKKPKSEEVEKIISKWQVYKLGDHFLAEGVLIGQHNQPYWITSESLTGQISIQEFIDITDYDIDIECKQQQEQQRKLLYAPKRTSYLNEPYRFDSIDQIKQIIEDVKANETPDTLFSQIKRQWKKYVNESDSHINLCSGDCVFTYFQDRLGSTHYLFFVADTEAGKTTNLQLYQKVGYRAFLGLDISTANIYRFYGNEYEGIGTLLEDEIDNLDEQADKFKIYKSGYTKGVKVPKSEKPSESEGFEQEGYYTYGFKAFAAERMPSSSRAKGFKERTIQMSCSFGLPEIDLSDVLDNADDPIYKPLLTELNTLKNRLLIYRILHYFDPIPNIDTKLQAREKQLWNPLLRVFQNTQTYDTLRIVAKEFIKESREQKSHSHTAFLLNIIIELELERKSLTFPTSDIWQKYKDVLPEGEVIGKTSYRSDEFGDMSQKRLNDILKDQFKARPPRHTGAKRELVFDKNTLDRLKQKYRLKIQNKSETDETDETDISLDRHLSQENSDNKTSNNTKENRDNSSKDEEKEENYMQQNDHESAYTTTNVSQASQATQTDSSRSSNDPEAYWKHGKWRENIQQ